MKRARSIALGVAVVVVFGQMQMTAGADQVSTIQLPAGQRDTAVTVTFRDAANNLEFGLSSPSQYEVCGPTEESPAGCVVGDSFTFTDLSGELVFYLTDHSCEGPPTYLSTDPASAMIDQGDATHWTIGWDDAGDCITRDGDFDDLIVDVAAESLADLSVMKSDTPPQGDFSFGPDPVGSGDVVVYKVTVENDGPDTANSVTVVDTPDKGTVLVQESENASPGWGCELLPGIEGPDSIRCVLADALPDGGTAELMIWVQAPLATTANKTINDHVEVSADGTDPTPGNNSDDEQTTVIGSQTAAGRDQDATFCDGDDTCTVQTARDTQGRFYSKIVAPPGFDGVLSINEVSAASNAVDGFCGGLDCQAQVQISVLPEGTAPENTPFVVTLFYVKDTKQTSKLWVKGDDETVASVVENCLVRGIADPAKCVNAKMVLKNGDRAFEMLWRDGGDPISGKR